MGLADAPSRPQNVPVTVWARTVLPLAGVKANAVAAAAMVRSRPAMKASRADRSAVTAAFAWSCSQFCEPFASQVVIFAGRAERRVHRAPRAIQQRKQPAQSENAHGQAGPAGEPVARAGEAIREPADNRVTSPARPLRHCSAVARTAASSPKGTAAARCAQRLLSMPGRSRGGWLIAQLRTASRHRSCCRRRGARGAGIRRGSTSRKVPGRSGRSRRRHLAG